MIPCHLARRMHGPRPIAVFSRWPISGCPEFELRPPYGGSFTSLTLPETPPGISSVKISLCMTLFTRFDALGAFLILLFSPGTYAICAAHAPRTTMRNGTFCSDRPFGGGPASFKRRTGPHTTQICQYYCPQYIADQHTDEKLRKRAVQPCHQNWCHDKYRGHDRPPKSCVYFCDFLN